MQFENHAEKDPLRGFSRRLPGPPLGNERGGSVVTLTIIVVFACAVVFAFNYVPFNQARQRVVLGMALGFEVMDHRVSDETISMLIVQLAKASNIDMDSEDIYIDRDFRQGSRVVTVEFDLPLRSKLLEKSRVIDTNITLQHTFEVDEIAAAAEDMRVAVIKHERSLRRKKRCITVINGVRMN